MKNDKILSLLSIAEKGGNVKSGEFLTEESVKRRRSKLVIVAEDASDNTKKRFENMCAHYKVPYITYADKESLGHAIGKEFRASLSVTEKGLAEKIKELFKGGFVNENT